MNYKNAYDYWQRQRGGFDSESIDAVVRGAISTPQLPFTPNVDHSFVGELGRGGGGGGTATAAAASSTTSNSAGNMLFLQLTVEDLGICLPLVNDSSQQTSSGTHLPSRERMSTNNATGGTLGGGGGGGGNANTMSSFASTLPEGVGSGGPDAADDGAIPGGAGGLASSTSSVVVTLESTQISACSTMAKGVVSKGRH